MWQLSFDLNLKENNPMNPSIWKAFQSRFLHKKIIFNIEKIIKKFKSDEQTLHLSKWWHCGFYSTVHYNHLLILSMKEF
jgi:hypothetical protein